MNRTTMLGTGDYGRPTSARWRITAIVAQPRKVRY